MAKKETAAVTDPNAITFDVPMPVGGASRAGAKSKYPFDDLPAPDGERVASFPLFDRDARKFQSTVYSAIKRYAKLDEAGKKIVERVRDFRVVNVDPATDPVGAIARVFRVK